jgi:hypothetical protein
MVDRQRFGGYQQHVLEEPPDELVGRDGLRRARRGSPTPPKPPTEGRPQSTVLGEVARPETAHRAAGRLSPASCLSSPSSLWLFSGDAISPDKPPNFLVEKHCSPPSESR